MAIAIYVEQPMRVRNAEVLEMQETMWEMLPYKLDKSVGRGQLRILLSEKLS